MRVEFFALCLVGVFLAIAGCSAPAPQVDEAELNLRRIVQAYGLIYGQNSRPPTRVEQLKRQFKELGDTRDPEEIMRSPRDGQPYVVILGVPMDGTDKSIMAYEQDGKDGKRYVVTMSYDVKVLTDDEFNSAAFAGDHKPSPRK